MSIFRNWKLHGLCIGVVIISELIGQQRFGIVVLLPMLFAMSIAGMLSLPKFKILSLGEMKASSSFLTLSLMLLIAKLGLAMGPAIPELQRASAALLVQEIGHFFGTIVLGMPVAIMCGMGREAVGATFSIARESNLAVIADRYALDSPEGRGAMAVYLFGSLFGALYVAILAGALGTLDLLHPYSLAMGAGVGSGSMMGAATGSIIALYPEHKDAVIAYAGAANLLSTILGIYVCLFVSLPAASFAYNLLSRFRKEKSPDFAASAPVNSTES